MNLKLFNGYGGFSQDYSEYCIIQNKNNRIPVAWSNIMANQNFGTVITDSYGGFTWYENSRTNRITKFENDAYMDKSSEIIYFDMDEKRWSTSLNYMPDNNEYITKYGFGYSIFNHISCELIQNITTFVPEKINSKITIINLKNQSISRKNIKIKYDIDYILGENDDGALEIKYNPSLNMNIVKNNSNQDYCVYVSSNESINENNEIKVELGGLEEKDIILVMGAEIDEDNCVEKSAECTNNYKKLLDQTKKYWLGLVGKIKSNTPSQAFDALQNGWLVYQTICSRLIAKTGFYQTSGGYGFRDQLQDAIGMKYISTEILKNQIILHARHQFSEGDVEHWWHEDSNIGIRTRYSDDLLWLPYATIEYIKYTGDYSILKEQIEYLEDDELNKNQIDRVSIYEPKKHSGRLEKYSLLDHCIRAIERSLKFGKNGLPLINGGDWNDGMNCIGKYGKGESVWLGFFLYDILKKFTTLLKSEENFYTGNIISKDMEIDINQNNEVNIVDTDTIKNMKQSIDEIIQKYEEIEMKLKKVLNTVAWDGRWYKRAFDDDGKEIGSIKNEECKIDSIAQSWSVISNAGDNDKKYIALESAEKYLIDNENNLIKLLTPSLENTNLGYITSYPKGTRENGGQYTHSAIWLLIAEIIMNSNNMAYEIYKKINPIEHTKNKQEVDKYKVEPYVVEADIYSEGALAGRGGWTWYTGSSSWLYTAQVEYILGIKIENDTMKIKPCVPDSWDKFNVNFKWNNAIYNIEYRRKIQKDTNEITEVKLSREGNYTIEVFY